MVEFYLKLKLILRIITYLTYICWEIDNFVIKSDIATSSFQLMRLMVSGDISPNPGPNTSPEEARRSETRRKCLDSNIKIAHLNIRSIKNRNSFLLVKEALMKHKFDILTISETWLDNYITDA